MPSQLFYLFIAVAEWLPTHPQACTLRVAHRQLQLLVRLCSVLFTGSVQRRTAMTPRLQTATPTSPVEPHRGHRACFTEWGEWQPELCKGLSGQCRATGPRTDTAGSREAGVWEECGRHSLLHDCARDEGQVAGVEDQSKRGGVDQSQEGRGPIKGGGNNVFACGLCEGRLAGRLGVAVSGEAGVHSTIGACTEGKRKGYSGSGGSEGVFGKRFKKRANEAGAAAAHAAEG